jgi:hypothetical protein
MYNPVKQHLGKFIMPKIIDLTGRKFGKLTVIERDRLPSGVSVWRCRCECGGERLAIGWNLTDGSAKSCGCVRNKGNTKHGEYRSEEWVSWMNMIQRCYALSMLGEEVEVPDELTTHIG